VDGCGGTVQGFAGCLEQQRVFYRRWVSRFTLRPEQFEMQYKVSAEKLGATNSLIRYLTPDIPRLRWAEADALTRRALLETALDVELPSNSALGRHLDPYDGKTFAWRVMDGGFRLDSRLKEGGTPLSISVHSDQSHAQ